MSRTSLALNFVVEYLVISPKVTSTLNPNAYLSGIDGKTRQFIYYGISIAITCWHMAPSATQLPCRVPLNGMFHQNSAKQWNKLRIWKICNYTSKFFVLNTLDKSHRNSVRAQYVCDKSENARVCAKWQWNKLDWCYWIALPASPVVQSSNTVSCVSLSFRTHPCVLTIKFCRQLVCVTGVADNIFPCKFCWCIHFV